MDIDATAPRLAQPTDRPAPTDPTELNQMWCDAFNDGDLPRLMSMYEPDAILVPCPGADPVVGLEAIEAALTWFLGLGGELRFTPRHHLVHGDVALGSIAFTMDGGTDADGNPFLLAGITAEVVRRQADGTWRYLIDHPFGGTD